MRTRGSILALFISFFANVGASAQCSSHLSTVSYDTTVNGSGSDLYTFSFPGFDPSLGTLTEVNIDAKVSLRFGYQLENSSVSPISNYKLKLECFDDVTSPALTDPLSNQKAGTYGPYNFAGSDGVPGSGLDYKNIAPFNVMNEQHFGATVYNTADFMGTGPVSFDFSSGSYITIMGPASISYTGNVQDEVNFKITYHYCPVTLLATDITSFTAGSTTDGNIDIKWITQNEKTNRKYELQKSTDGRVYRRVTELAAQTGSTQTGSYRYSYQIQPDDRNKTILFRIKLIEQDGSSKYSSARAVKLRSGEIEQPVLYPNPAKGATTLLFSNNKRGNWEVEIMTISGQVVKRCFFNNALLAKLNTANDLHRGLYVIRSTNRSTQEQFVQRLLVQ